MKTKKKAGQESSLSCRFFLVFPGCTASGWRCFTPPSPWPAVRASNSQKCNLPLQRGFCVAAVPQPARQATTFISEGVSACGSAGTQFAKFQSFFCTDVCACYVVSPGHRLRDMNCQFRHRVKGRCPLWGAGVKPRMVPQSSPGNCMKDTICYIRNWVQGTALVQG